MARPTLSSPTPRISTKLVLSYVLDWIVVVAIAAVGAAFSRATPYHRPFYLANPEISFPHVKKEQIPVVALGVIALAAPALIILLICLIFIPGPSVRKGTSRSVIFRLKLWEWHTGWLGLGLALATVFLFTEGMKNLFGKARPDLLGRCDADLTKIVTSTVGGFGDRVSQGIVLVSSAICRQKDKHVLNDGFKSFPSGHASFSFAGMTYLTLFICSKFALRIPYLLPYPHSSTPSTASTALNSSTLPSKTNPSAINLFRHQSAAPPVYLLIPALVPICAAVYISSTRYTDFRHQGFDIIFGATMGFVLAWASFRMYHLPVRRGAGWSWGPRSIDHAWGAGVGVSSYADVNQWEAEKRTGNAAEGAWPNSNMSQDVEAGR